MPSARDNRIPFLPVIPHSFDPGNEVSRNAMMRYDHLPRIPHRESWLWGPTGGAFPGGGHVKKPV